MNNYQSFIQRFVSLLFVFAVFSCSKSPGVNDLLSKNDLCDLSRDPCMISSQFGSIKMAFLKPPIVEEEITIVFTLPRDVIVDKAQVEGINMFMGITPVLFEKPSEPETGITFLGSCSEPAMAWRLSVRLLDKSTGETDVINAGFVTYQ